MPRKGPPTTMEMGFDMKLPILASERPGPSHMGILGPFPIVKSGEREITERPRSKIVRLSNSGRFGVWLWDRWSVRSITAPSCPSNSQSLLINSVFGYALPMNVPSPVLGQVYPGGIFSQPFDQQAVVEIKVNLGETLLVPSYWDTLFAQGEPDVGQKEPTTAGVNCRIRVGFRLEISLSLYKPGRRSTGQTVLKRNLPIWSRLWTCFELLL
ncbi:hypothetical protein AFCA_002745 [Aspergillus flavus]|uniref:Unnamed protein product n=2 Tax=Aspergillus oryzae TaxID=5062 RepID=A0AAN4YB04_ASPOZ|nr:hypothetical protein AFCA_002745 [Aspergillus flavus]GMG25799.1 unnamed protein product [Aspergillus oryzae]